MCDRKKSLLEINELLSAVNGTLVSENKTGAFTFVQTDSRNVVTGTLFVPLRGEQQNGHKYIPQALEKGASVVFIDKKEFKENTGVYKALGEQYPGAVLICVANNLYALQQAAEAYVAKFPELVKISITGSSGKTTTKEMAVSIMRQHFGVEGVACTEGNFNSETGLPLSVFKIRGDEKVGIFEMGMNRVNEIGEISKVLKSKYGIITNIGNAHIGLLGSRKNIALEKRKSFDYIPADGAAFVPYEDDFAELCTEHVKGKIVKYGLETAREFGVELIKDDGLAGTVFSVDGEVIRLGLAGKYNFQNALGVIALAKELGVSAKEIKAGLENMTAVTGRMEIKKLKTRTGKSIYLIADCYNANPDSMSKVIDFCGGVVGSTENSVGGKKIYVLGDMKELGAESTTEHRKVAEKLLAVGADYVCLIGPEMKSAADLLSEKQFNSFAYFETNDEESFNRISEKLLSVITEGDTVLLKGSHSMALEKLIPMLVLEEEVQNEQI